MVGEEEQEVGEVEQLDIADCQNLHSQIVSLCNLTELF
jgi:hypothetical protein